MRSTPRGLIWLLAPCAFAGLACASTDSSDEQVGVSQAEVQISLDCDPASSSKCAKARLKEGRRLFDKETFGGNGRTCETCHSKSDGTIDPAEVQARLADDPNDPLFVHDGLDNFTSGTSRIEANATILIVRELPEGVVLADDPTATSMVVARGVPGTMNTPALDPALMYDIRNPTLQDQALGAIHGHAQNTVEPTELELDLIAEFQQKDDRFFSSDALQDFAEGGPAPGLPLGNTASEQRGREFFVDAPFSPPSKQGVCALCHSGDMMNELNVFGAAETGAPPGFRAFDIGVNDVNRLNLPVHPVDVTDYCDNTVTVVTPDPGLLLTDPWTIPAFQPFLPPKFLCLLHPAFFANQFKIPSLRGVRFTAPYFHDASAKTFEEVMDQYVFFFTNSQSLGGQIEFTQQDIDDIIAFLNLL